MGGGVQSEQRSRKEALAIAKSWAVRINKQEAGEVRRTTVDMFRRFDPKRVGETTNAYVSVVGKGIVCRHCLEFPCRCLPGIRQGD